MKSQNEPLDSWTDGDLQYVKDWWPFWANDEQLPLTEKPWQIWLFMGGRGSGKTRAGAEWVADGIREKKMQRVALIGATHHDARSVMIEGPAGLLAVSEGAGYEPSLRRIIWPWGAVADVLSADEPDSIRGHQFDAAWCDEFCKWPDPQTGLDMTLMALRLGEEPRMAITTTPRAIPALKGLMASSDVTVTQGSTRANAVNLPRDFLRIMERRYGGTQLGRQEIDGELIEDNEHALWQRGWIERHRVREVPDFKRVVVAVDPPAGVRRAECGIVVAALGQNGEAYVIADRSKDRATPREWASQVMDAYEEFRADAIIAEANQGGEMVRSNLHQALFTAPVKLVFATRDKITRADPFAALYERGLVHHVGYFAELEDQMCQYDGSGKSPDRLDALVWALAELMPQTRKPEPRVWVP